MISSTSNKRIKDIAALVKKSSVRYERECFIVEGIKMFSEIPDEDVLEVYVSESFLKSSDQDIKKRLTSLKSETVSDTVYAYMSDTKTPQGILAVVKMKKYALEDIKDGQIIILEHLQDPGNLGTIMRSAEAAGISAVIMDGGTVDIYNPKTVRSTMGTIFRVPFVYTDGLTETINILKSRGYRIYAAHLAGANDFSSIDYPEKTAFAVGNESSGLSEEIADAADVRVKIPMLGKVESLNASVAASLLMFEYMRRYKV